MGSSEAQMNTGTTAFEPPQLTVYLDAYWIDQTEVANAQFNQCVASSFCTGGNAAPEWADYPVTSLPWNQAQEYCRWAGGRLPTDAEWEKAARGTDGRTYPWGESIDCNHTRYDGEGCSGSVVLAVGSIPAGAGPYGALDMAGNVAEYVSDARIVRGGNPYSFEPNIVNTRESLRTAHHSISSYFSDSGTPMVGFRCVQSP
jgi:formylglycine-generating enzyme required for sulfatase activity